MLYSTSLKCTSFTLVLNFGKAHICFSACAWVRSCDCSVVTYVNITGGEVTNLSGRVWAFFARSLWFRFFLLCINPQQTLKSLPCEYLLRVCVDSCTMYWSIFNFEKLSIDTWYAEAGVDWTLNQLQLPIERWTNKQNTSYVTNALIAITNVNVHCFY